MIVKYFFALSFLCSGIALKAMISGPLPAPLQLPPFSVRKEIKDESCQSIEDLNRAASLLLLQNEFFKISHIYNASVVSVKKNNNTVAYGIEPLDHQHKFLKNFNDLGVNTQDPEVVSSLLIFLKHLKSPESPEQEPMPKPDAFAQVVMQEEEFLECLVGHANPEVFKAGVILKKTYCDQSESQLLIRQAVIWYIDARVRCLNLLLHCITGFQKPITIPQALHNYALTLQPLQEYKKRDDVISRCLASLDKNSKERSRLAERSFALLHEFNDAYRGIRQQTALVYSSMVEYLRSKHGTTYDASGLFMAGLKTGQGKALPDIFGGILPRELSMTVIDDPAEVIGYKPIELPKDHPEQSPILPKSSKQTSCTKKSQPSKIKTSAANNFDCVPQKVPRVRSKIKVEIDPQYNLTLGFFNVLKPMRTQKNIVNWRYDKRIMEWFLDKDKALEKQGYTDPNNPKYKYRDTAAFYHGYTLAADKWITKYGHQKIRKSENKLEYVIVVPGYIQHTTGTHGEITYGLYKYIIDATGECYHRCFEPRTLNQLVTLFADTNNWDSILNQLATD